MNSPLFSPTPSPASPAQISRLLSERKFDQACLVAARLHERQPSGEAKALLALSAAMAGRNELALARLAELPTPESAGGLEGRLAAGSAWFKLNDVGRAIVFLRAAASLDAAHALVQARLGACLLAAGKLAQAMPCLLAAVSALPKSGGARLNLARAHLVAGQAAEALAELDRASAFNDKDEELALISRAEALTLLGRTAEADELLHQAVAQGTALTVASAVNMLAFNGRHDEAWHVLGEGLNRHASDTALMALATELAHVRGRFVEAVHWLKKALALDPDNPRLWAQLATLSTRRGDPTEAEAAALRALAITAEQQTPARALALQAQANVLAFGRGNHSDMTQAEALYRQALEISPACAPAISGLGQLLMQLGRIEEAISCFHKLREMAPLQGWSQLIHARELPDDAAVLEQMERMAHRPSLDGPVQSHLLFTLAQAWERKKDYDRAWQCAVAANAAAKSRLPYRPERHRELIEREMARFSAAFMATRAALGIVGSDSEQPVFVVGMPRSGTTLVEQILGSHSRIFGAGELSQIPELIQKLNAWESKLGSRRSYPECVDDLSAEEVQRFAARMLEQLKRFAPNAARIVDKLPHNFEHIGLIKLLFPNARILHLQREPRDIALSNYFIDYSAKFGGMGFAYDLQWIGEQLVDHQRLMAHWHEVFPGQILTIDYDQLVVDVDTWARRIIDYLGLPWEPGVLAFQTLERTVKTASVWQVRQPIYTSSKARWLPYRAQLDTLEQALAAVPSEPPALSPPFLAPGLFFVGMRHLHAQCFGEAEAVFRQILAERPQHAAAQHFLGTVLYSQGRYDEARTVLRRSLQLHRGHAHWLENLAACEDKLGHGDAANRLRAQESRMKNNIHHTAGALPDIDAPAGDY